ncbi:MAG: hypothetical protein KBC17_02655 [Candidatus Pacebacteria bacterium]|nr:hypothetical protein [Candidatus Paceibacterota bacterium]
MASLNFQKVVGLLGENLASFLKLAEKLLITWGIEPQKLIHALNHVSKDALFGLMNGTHEIVSKAKPVQLVTGDEGFVCIYESKEYITIPSEDAVKEHSQKWGEKVGGATPSQLPEAGAQKKVKVFQRKGGFSSEQALAFIKSIPGAGLYGVRSVAIAEMTDQNLPKDTHFLGFDEKGNLAVFDGRVRVARLYLGSDGGVRRDSRPWDGDWPGRCCLVVLCD